MSAHLWLKRTSPPHVRHPTPSLPGLALRLLITFPPLHRRLTECCVPPPPRYLDLLVAPLASQPEVYQQRSPLAHAQDMAAPVIFFQVGAVRGHTGPAQSLRTRSGVLDGRSPSSCSRWAGQGDTPAWRSGRKQETVLGVGGTGFPVQVVWASRL